MSGSSTARENADRPVGLVILAAGASTRLGRPKQLLIYQKRSLLRRAAEVAGGSVCHPIAVVLGAYAAQLIDEVGDLLVQAVINPNWQKGMSSSIRIGIHALEAGTPPDQEMEAVVIMLCDQPLVTTPVIDNLVGAYRATGRPIIASEYDGTLGVPALFDRKVFADLIALREVEGAKKVIKDHARQVFRIPFAPGATDIDTPMDYARLLTMSEQGG